jgi:hypothetical protein
MSHYNVEIIGDLSVVNIFEPLCFNSVLIEMRGTGVHGALVRRSGGGICAWGGTNSFVFCFFSCLSCACGSAG